MEFKVHLEQFDGPLDLMLHLISKNKLDLFDLDLDILASQYCAFIEESLSRLDVASEYMVEFSALLEYKSRKLLPKKEAELEDNWQEDLRDKLAARLIEYQAIQQAAMQLGAMHEKRQTLIDRPASKAIETWAVPREEGSVEGLSSYDLSRAMKRVLRRYALLSPYETSIQIKELSVEERIAEIEKRLPFLPEVCSFEQLCSDCSSLHEVIVTFLAVLEMIHREGLAYTMDEKDNLWIQKLHL